MIISVNQRKNSHFISVVTYIFLSNLMFNSVILTLDSYINLEMSWRHQNQVTWILPISFQKIIFSCFINNKKIQRKILHKPVFHFCKPSFGSCRNLGTYILIHVEINTPWFCIYFIPITVFFPSIIAYLTLYFYFQYSHILHSKT